MIILTLVVGYGKTGPTLTPAPPTDMPEPTPALGDTWTRPAGGMVMVYVPAGESEMRSDDDEVNSASQMCNTYYGDCEREWFEGEQPVHTRSVPTVRGGGGLRPTGKEWFGDSRHVLRRQRLRRLPGHLYQLAPGGCLL